jgi:hypothetical protein
MIILDDDIIIRRIPAKEDTTIFKFFWNKFQLFDEAGKQIKTLIYK